MLDIRLARLGLPLPLETAIRRALTNRERAAQHEGLVLAWELATRILAGSLWAACRQLGASSPALEKASAELGRPSTGHWIQLARTCAGLLHERPEPAARAFRATLDGLEQSIPAEGGLRLLVDRIGMLPDAPKRARRVRELLDQISFYRNKAQSTHNAGETKFREESVPALLEGLIDFCERVPLCGAFSLVLVGRLERRGNGGSVELARLAGTFPSWSEYELPESTLSALRSSRPYLFLEPALAVPLFPMAAVKSTGADWHVGWYAGHASVPTVAYQSASGIDFQVALTPEELASLAGGSLSGPGAAVNAEALRLDPYRGLLAYDQAHASIFFGREEETKEALGQIEKCGVLFVHGPSASGKSSWLRAGILPALNASAALAGRTLLPIVMVPGDRPLASLRNALTLAHGEAKTTKQALAWTRTVSEGIPDDPPATDNMGLARLLRMLTTSASMPVFVIDQLEEAATTESEHPEEARAFLALVAGAARTAQAGGYVVLGSARSDLFASLHEDETVCRVFQADGWPIRSIPTERLMRVVFEPLRGRNVPVEPGLPDMIALDVGDEPGALALLSEVLATLWSERSRFGGALTKQGYIDAGRVGGALNGQAEAALAEAVAKSPDASRQIDRLFRALATNIKGKRFGRRRLRFAALASELGSSSDDVRALIQPFVARHLIVLAGEVGQETVEVAHERLFDAWPHVANFLASQRDVLDLRREIANAAIGWESSGKKRELWSDDQSRLRRGEELLAKGRLDLDARGRAFLTASRARVTRRKRVEGSMIAMMGMLAIGAGVMWSKEAAARDTADQATRKANEKTLAAEAARAEADRQTAKTQEVLKIATTKAKEVLYLSAIQDLNDLKARAENLWPAYPSTLPAYEGWYAQASDLVMGKPGTKPSLADHQRRLADLRGRAKERNAAQIETARREDPLYPEWEKRSADLKLLRGLAEPGLAAGVNVSTQIQDAEKQLAALSTQMDERAQYEFVDDGDRWWYAQLSWLVTELNVFTSKTEGGIDSFGTSAISGWGVLKRMEVAKAIQNTMESEQAKHEWSRAIASISSGGPYGTLVLAQQNAMLPLDADPDSGLWEFVDLQTGEPPASVNGRFVPTENSGLVFVLIPGRTFWMGAQGDKQSERNYEAKAPTNEGPPHQVTLLPYFISKYEMTQGQWEYVTGENPSEWGPKRYQSACSSAGKAWTHRHPVENVSLESCEQVLGRLGMIVPSEPQWECAARADTSTAWWTGSELSLLQGAANLADKFAGTYEEKHKAVAPLAYNNELDDGNYLHAEVGSFRANRYGLFDVCGNVAEWCGNGYYSYNATSRLDDRESLAGRMERRVYRGGSYNDLASHATSAYRMLAAPGNKQNMLGIRPARRIESAPVPNQARDR